MKKSKFITDEMYFRNKKNHKELQNKINPKKYTEQEIQAIKKAKLEEREVKQNG